MLSILSSIVYLYIHAYIHTCMHIFEKYEAVTPAISQCILPLFSLVREKFIHEIEPFDWWKYLSGYSLRIRDELLFSMKLLFGPPHFLHRSACF